MNYFPTLCCLPGIFRCEIGLVEKSRSQKKKQKSAGLSLHFVWSILAKTTILYVSPKEQNTRMNLTFLSGVLVRNGGSFEDDLSLGAEGKFFFGRNAFSYRFKIKKKRLSAFRFTVLSQS